MHKLPLDEYSRAVPYIAGSSCGAVYPLSVAEGIQSGDIYVCHDSILIRHFCGFAFMYGNLGSGFTGRVYEMFLSGSARTEGRFLLFAGDGETAGRFLAGGNVTVGKRFFFEYSSQSGAAEPVLPAGFELRPVDTALYGKLSGKVSPAVFWRQPSDFLRNGMGYCAVKDGNPCAWAFSASVSSQEIDIGVQTHPDYQRLGLAAAVAGKMAEYALSHNKRPVWACRSGNSASRNLAEKLGFVKSSECFVVERIDT